MVFTALCRFPIQYFRSEIYSILRAKSRLCIRQKSSDKLNPGYYVNLTAFGARLKIAPNMAMNMSIGYNYQQCVHEEKYYHYRNGGFHFYESYTRRLHHHGPSLRIGVEF